MDYPEDEPSKAEKRKINKANHKKTPTCRAPISTPLGVKQRMQQFKELLCKDEHGTACITKVLEIAQDNEHPGQVACLKMCLDRLLPMSIFEEKKDGARTAININISGIGETKVDGETIDA